MDVLAFFGVNAADLFGTSNTVAFAALLAVSILIVTRILLKAFWHQPAPIEGADANIFDGARRIVRADANRFAQTDLAEILTAASRKKQNRAADHESEALHRGLGSVEASARSIAHVILALQENGDSVSYAQRRQAVRQIKAEAKDINLIAWRTFGPQLIAGEMPNQEVSQLAVSFNQARRLKAAAARLSSSASVSDLAAILALSSSVVEASQKPEAHISEHASDDDIEQDATDGSQQAA